MNVLHVAPAFYPAVNWGGPTFSTLALCNALCQLPGVSLRVLTTDTAGRRRSEYVDPAALPPGFPPGYEIHYCKRRIGVDIAPSLPGLLWKWAKWADVIHLTAVYSFPTLPTLAVARVLQKPLIWSPRGAFISWEPAPALKKRLWDRMATTLLARRRTAFHVTSAREEAAVAARMPGCRTVIIPNSLNLPSMPPSRKWKPGGTCRLLFLGRLHPIKGLENLIDAYALLPQHQFSLRICGTGEPTYVAALKERAMRLGLRNVVFTGHVDELERDHILDESDILILPSHSENFGMVVIEALARAVPVIASKGTPWQALDEAGCGRWVDALPVKLADSILELHSSDLEAMGKAGHAWVNRHYSPAACATTMHHLYLSLLDSAGTP